MTVVMNADEWMKAIDEAMALGMRTVGELLAYVNAKKTGVIKNPERHIIKKYQWRWL